MCVKVKDLRVYVIMSGDRVYYSDRSGGSPFYSDLSAASLYRNKSRAEAKIRSGIRNAKDRLERGEKFNHPSQAMESHASRLEEWQKSRVVKVKK